MKKCSKKVPLGSRRHHFKHYRRNQFTEETAYFRTINGQKVPLEPCELEWLRKFQWDEISCNNRARLNTDARKEQDHGQHAKRNDVMNIALAGVPEAFLESVNSHYIDNQIQMIEAESVLQTIECNDSEAFLDVIEPIKDLDKSKALKLFEQFQNNKAKALALPKKKWRKRHNRKYRK